MPSSSRSQVWPLSRGRPSPPLRPSPSDCPETSLTAWASPALRAFSGGEVSESCDGRVGLIRVLLVFVSPLSRCCEKTLEVMRNSQEALLTIVEVRRQGPGPLHKLCPSPACGSVQVLLYDPLFDWTMNPLKAFYLQRDEQQELNATLGSTTGGENMENQRKFRCGDSQNT